MTTDAKVKKTKSRVHLTDAEVKKLPAPATGNRLFFDDDVGGLACRVTAGGAKSFVLCYVVRSTGRQRRYTIGSTTDWRCTAARQEAQRLRALIDGGADPMGAIHESRAAPTVAELAERFKEEHMPRKRPSTREGYEQQLRLHILPAIGSTKVSDIEFGDIDKLHRGVTRKAGPYIANRCIQLASKMFSLAIRWGMRSDNPCEGVERNFEEKRKRYMTGPELTRLVEALEAHPDQQSANIIRICLLTGCRKGEAFAMRWDAIDFEQGLWTKPGSTTKQKTDHTVPLSAPTLQLLSEIQEQQGKRRSPFVFPNAANKTGHQGDVKKSWRTLCRAANIKGLRIHDLRHSFASNLVSSDASLPLIASLLGHASITTTQRYAHMYQDPQRAAAERVAALVTAAGKPGAEVVPMTKRK